MTLYYNGVDITDAVNIKEATHSDASSGRCDRLEITFFDPSNWYAWQPQPDDIVRFEHNGYDTEDLYVSAFEPEADLYRLTALSIPQKARVKRWQSFKNMKLRDIVYACAAECGMGYGIFGIDENIRYPFLLRRNEGVAAFLDRIASYEGAVLKCVGGKLIMIGIEYAQKLEAVRSWEFDTRSVGVTYLHRSDNAAECMIVRSRDGDARAIDPSIRNGVTIYSDAPAACASDAGRWARGLLLHNNRKTERVSVNLAFDPGVSAMQRVTVSGSTDMTGDWIIDSVTQDFINMKTSVLMYRSVTAP